MSEAFADRLLGWFAVHGRGDLPWQVNRTPYRVWVSEVMLQQTQVATVIPYYLRFMDAYPDVVCLADAPVDDVLKLWSGLGYYARARNLYKAACEIRDHHGGEFPREFEQIVALPGVGRSTAGAIVALSRGERHAILDGNVKRVLARYHAVAGWPGSSSVARDLWLLAEQHTPETRVADYTQAIMDLGATVCTRTRPACVSCPLSDGCVACATRRIEEFPATRPKKDKPRRQTHMVLALCNGDVYLERRPPFGIWGGLWSLPELERDDELEAWCQERLAAQPVDIERWTPLRHSFTHFDLDIRPVAVRVADVSRKLEDGSDRVWHDYRKEAPFGIAAPVIKLIDQLKTTSERN
jgi:A/G-specific adenine glycosylase